MMGRSLFLLTVLMTAAPAVAQQSAPSVHAGYETYALGVPVAALSTDFALGPRDYRIDLAYHTVGLVGALFGGHQTSTVEGSWEGDRPEPRRFLGDGIWRGQARQTLIDYRGGAPIVRSLVPPNDTERESVPPSLQEGSIDTLSALALLIRQVAHTGRCEAEVTTFDGRRAVDMVARTAGHEVLEPTGRSIYAGPALRCDFDGRMVAGYLLGADAAQAARPQHGSAWLASVVPGGPPVPVRISFDTRWFGPATMYLTELDTRTN
jgi:hypothetical protein